MRRETKEIEARELDRAIRDWRGQGSEEQLAAPTRARILEAVTERAAHGGSTAPLIPLFLPVRRLALAAGLPALVLALALGYGARIAENPGEFGEPRLIATKQAGEVVFIIANGGRPHRVYRSTDPARLGTEAAFTATDGSFRDRLDSGPDLVFYRID